jgi:hypothetical protein
MSDSEQYEGWTNRETWAVALHINNDQGWQASVHEAIKPYEDAEGDVVSYDAWAAGEIIRENVEETLNLLWQGRDNAREYDETVFSTVREDIGSLWRVNWTELGAAFLADLEEGVEDQRYTGGE